MMGRGGGGYKTEGGGQVKFYPYKKGGGRKSCSHAERGGTQTFEVVLTQELEVLAILMGGGRLKFPPFKRGGAQKVLPCLKGGGAKSFGPPEFSIL